MEWNVLKHQILLPLLLLFLLLLTPSLSFAPLSSHLFLLTLHSTQLFFFADLLTRHGTPFYVSLRTHALYLQNACRPYGLQIISGTRKLLLLYRITLSLSLTSCLLIYPSFLLTVYLPVSSYPFFVSSFLAEFTPPLFSFSPSFSLSYYYHYQVDDGYQRAWGDWLQLHLTRFPSQSMTHIVDKIKGK